MNAIKKNTLLTISLGISLLLTAQLAQAEKASKDSSSPNHFIKRELIRQTILVRGTSLAEYGNKINQVDSLNAKIYFKAADSTKFSKDKSIISLYGRAIFTYGNLNLKANEIVYNSKTQKVTAKEFRLFDKDNQITATGTYAEFDLKAKN